MAAREMAGVERVGRLFELLVEKMLIAESYWGR